MKLTQSRSCVPRKPLPVAPRSRKISKVPRRMPQPPLQVINLQRRRYHSTLEVIIKDCSTVGDLKKAIATQQNLSVIALLFRGVPLDDTRQLEKLLTDHRIGPPRFTVHTRVRPRAIQAGVLSINVLTLNRKTFQVPLHSLDSTVMELKSAITDYEGMSMGQIALTYQGKQLNEDDHTLREYNIKPGSTVTLVGRLRGGWRPRVLACGEVRVAPDLPEPTSFADIENTSLFERFRLQPQIAQDWRICEEGLNVEGECWNEQCDAYRQMVICPLQFAVFNLEEEVNCPLCKTAIRAVTCGFYKCMWMFEGRKVGVGKIDVASQWMEVAGNTYQRFDEGAERSTAEWSSLIITAKNLPNRKNMKAFHGNGDCPICHEEFTSFSKQCTIKCKHAFHRECVMEWQKRGNTTCPMCRDPFE